MIKIIKKESNVESTHLRGFYHFVKITIISFYGLIIPINIMEYAWSSI